MNIKEILNDIVLEVSYRCKDGKPNWKNPKHISILSELLSESKLNPIKNEIIGRLLETDNPEDDKYKHVGGSAFVKAGDYDEKSGKGKDGASHYKKDPQTGSYSPMSPTEYEDEKSDQGEKGGEKNNPQNQEKDKTADVEQPKDGEAPVEEPETGTSLKDKDFQKRIQGEKNAANSNSGEDTGELFNIGGGYYSSKKDGEPEYKKVEENVMSVSGGGDVNVEKLPNDTDNKPVSASYVKKKDLRNIKSVELFNEDGKFAKDGVVDETFTKNKNVKPTQKQINISENEMDRMLGKPRKFPKKYEKVLIRLLNTKKGSGLTISDFTDAAGGGTLESTAGEILAMVSLSITDKDDRNELLDKLAEHTKSTGKSGIISSSWVKSARLVSNTTHSRYDRMYGKGKWEMESMAWDIPNEVEALGLVQYKQNKGFSTDTYAKIKVNGKSILDEITLKKDKQANLFNSTTGRLQDIYFRGYATPDENELLDSLEDQIKKIDTAEATVDQKKKVKELKDTIKKMYDKYTGAIPPVASVKKTQENQVNIHDTNLTKYTNDIKTMSSVFLKLSKEKKDKLYHNLKLSMGQKTAMNETQISNFEKILTMVHPPLTLDGIKSYHKELGLKTSSRAYQKTSTEILALAKLMGNPAGVGYDELRENSFKHSTAVADLIISNDKVRAGLLKSIKEDFPLQALMSGEESMVLGDISADKQILGIIFDGKTFEEMNENLIIDKDPPPSTIVYTLESGKIVPIAEINSRPDGIGYGGTWKLEMKIHKSFTDALQKTQKELESKIK